MAMAAKNRSRANVAEIPAWPAAQVVDRSVDTLKPYANNPRTHTDEQVAQIAASIQEWGWTTPVLIDEEDVIIAGHGRVRAAKSIGIDTVPCMVASGWTDAQRRAYVIADNQLAANAGWDDELLALELSELTDASFDLPLLGFDDAHLSKLLTPNPDDVTDDTPPKVPDAACTQRGDVWHLGDHRLICGDATDADVWTALDIGDNACAFTSPPYNGGEALMKMRGHNASGDREIYLSHTDDMSEQDYRGMLDAMLAHALTHCNLAVINVQPIAGSKRAIIEWMSAHIDNYCDLITWDKSHAAPAMAPGVLSSTYEWLVLMVRSDKGPASRRIPMTSWRGTHQSIYRGGSQTQNEFASIHGATFPLHLPAYVIGSLADQCERVVDCFMGTGTTIIAAEQMQRIAYGIELEPRYVDASVMRWQAFTGQQATDPDGRLFDDVAAERLT